MSVKLITHLLAMVRVTDVEDEEAPTVLLVDNNQMSLHRLTNIFRQREFNVCLLYTSPSPRDRTRSRMPSSA